MGVATSSIITTDGVTVVARGGDSAIVIGGGSGMRVNTSSTSLCRRGASTITNGNVSVISRGGAVSMSRNQGSGSHPVDIIKTSGDETEIIYNGPPAVYVTVKNMGGDCTLTQVVEGERVVTRIASNTTVTVSPKGQPTVVPLSPRPRPWRRLFLPVGVALVSLSLGFYLFSQQQQ
ncbi:hypothetical protein pqer_cds_823 [Pandoravirus quercus]|uniref:Uncharacterized protein n=1 Tax=Pandoravirus quercus TaxID=2107709 RepID=A0A2U7UA36_9VIRU|nr:hypothetical protein pqer_cds_823 [Pandoravirus quercus]AVK75245.1 hypothetical protein pqer_cds_823 [Pandoravirus quercus]